MSRRIAQFIDDHKLFQCFSKQFIYGGKDHQETLLGHATVLTEFLRQKKSESYKTYACPSLENVYGFLQYSVVDEFPESVYNPSQNAQDADDAYLQKSIISHGSRGSNDSFKDKGAAQLMNKRAA